MQQAADNTTFSVIRSPSSVRRLCTTSVWFIFPSYGSGPSSGGALINLASEMNKLQDEFTDFQKHMAYSVYSFVKAAKNKANDRASTIY